MKPQPAAPAYPHARRSPDRLVTRVALLCSGLVALADGEVEEARITIGLHAAGAIDARSSVPPGTSPARLHVLAGRLLTPPRSAS